LGRFAAIRPRLVLAGLDPRSGTRTSPSGRRRSGRRRSAGWPPDPVAGRRL